MDIWRAGAVQDPKSSSQVVGYTGQIGGICTPVGYSIVEFMGFNQIQNGAHEMAHRWITFHKITT